MGLKAKVIRTARLLLTALTWATGGTAVAGPVDQDVLSPVSDIAIFAGSLPDARSIGLLSVGTRATVLERRGARTRVLIGGWYQEGAARLFYAMPGKRILDLVISKEATGLIADQETLADAETGLVWRRATFEGWVASDRLTEDVDGIWARADRLFSSRCTVCHQRRVPHHYTANQWISNVRAMAPRAGLSKQDRNLITRFLQYRAKDVVGQGGAGQTGAGQTGTGQAEQ